MTTEFTESVEQNSLAPESKDHRKSSREWRRYFRTDKKWLNPDRLDIILAALIAFVSRFTAFAAWHTSEVGSSAADGYQKWNAKADADVAILTVLAIAFFLLGLAQSSERMRVFFAISALVIMLGAGLWTGFVIIT